MLRSLHPWRSRLICRQASRPTTSCLSHNSFGYCHTSVVRALQRSFCVASKRKSAIHLYPGSSPISTDSYQTQSRLRQHTMELPSKSSSYKEEQLNDILTDNDTAYPSSTNVIHITVPTLVSSERIDRFLIDNLKLQDIQVSRSRLQKLIELGKCLVNGHPIKKNAKVKSNDVIQLELVEEPKQRVIEPVEFPLNIVYEDEHIAVINKAPGLSVHPGAGEDSKITLVHALLHKYGAEGLSNLGGPDRPGIVHRLDMDTSGLMVICKTNAAHQRLYEDFHERAASLSKIYYAVVLGKFSQESGSISSRIMRHPSQRSKMTTTTDPTLGKEALTEYRVERVWCAQRNTYYSLVRVKIHTGRTHQIRVHMASLSHPIVGDAIYSRKHAKHGVDYLLLVSKELQFAHPITREILKFEVPFPKHFADWMTAMDKIDAKEKRR